MHDLIFFWSHFLTTVPYVQQLVAGIRAFYTAQVKTLKSKHEKTMTVTILILYKFNPKCKSNNAMVITEMKVLFKNRFHVEVKTVLVGLMCLVL